MHPEIKSFYQQNGFVCTSASLMDVGYNEDSLKGIDHWYFYPKDKGISQHIATQIKNGATQYYWWSHVLTEEQMLRLIRFKQNFPELTKLNASRD
jgi:hypothetical protein